MHRYTTNQFRARLIDVSLFSSMITEELTFKFHKLMHLLKLSKYWSNIIFVIYCYLLDSSSSWVSANLCIRTEVLCMNLKQLRFVGVYLVNFSKNEHPERKSDLSSLNFVFEYKNDVFAASTFFKVIENFC